MAQPPEKRAKPRARRIIRNRAEYSNFPYDSVHIHFSSQRGCREGPFENGRRRSGAATTRSRPCADLLDGPSCRRPCQGGPHSSPHTGRRFGASSKPIVMLPAQRTARHLPCRSSTTDSSRRRILEFSCSISIVWTQVPPPAPIPPPPRRQFRLALSARKARPEKLPSIRRAFCSRATNPAEHKGWPLQGA